jgi:hypothetical protein
MKKLSHLGVALLLSATMQVGQAADVVISPYTQGFEEGSTDITVYSGWDRIEDTVETFSFYYNTSSTYKHGGSYSFGTTYAQAKSVWVSGSTYRDAQKHDYIVTPLVSGEVKFWARPYSTSTYSSSLPQLEVYNCSEVDGTLVVDTEAVLNLTETLRGLEDKTSWYEYTIAAPEDGQPRRLAFLMGNVYIDDFSAASATMTEKRALTIGSWTLPTGYSTTVDQAADGTFPVNGTITLTNSGNVALSPDDENCYLQLRSSETTIEKHVFDDHIALPSVMQPGESVTLNYAKSLTVPDYATLTSYGQQYQLGLELEFAETGATGAIKTYYVNPYIPIMRIKSGSSWYYSSAADDFGTCFGTVEKSYEIYNNGLAELVIHSVECPDGYNVVLPEGVTFPLTIAAKSSQPFTVTLSGNKTATYAGTITFDVAEGALCTYNSQATNIINVTGVAVSATDYQEDFSDIANGEIPVGWYNEPSEKANKWSVTEYNGNKVLYSSSTSMTDYVGVSVDTPKLHFEEGESIFFDAAYAASYTSTSVNLFVYYSTDRSNWTPLGQLVSSASVQTTYPDAVMLPSTSKTFKQYGYTMPEGDYYIRFDAGNIYVDNVFGGKLADVDYDVTAGAMTVSMNPTVNNAATVTASFQNILSTMSAGSYTVKFYENDKLIATAETPDFATGTTEFTASYYPHTTGEVALKAVFAVADSDYSKEVSTTATVLAEAAVSEVQVGTMPTTASSSAQAPLSYNYAFSKSEFVYKADELGLTNGAKMIKLAYPYYCANDKGYKTHIRIWLQNTTDETIGDAFTAESDMTLVFEDAERPSLPVSGGDNTSYSGRAEFVLDTPYVYTGGSLRVVVESLAEADSKWQSVSFASDSTKKREFLYKQSDYSAQYATVDTKKPQYESSYAFPILIISTEKALTANTGVVKDSDGNLIEGAVVTAEHVVDDNNSIIYEATTDENGAYSFTIFRDDVEDYAFTATKEGYEPYEGSTTMGEQDREVVLASTAVEPAMPETLNIIGTFKVGDEVVAWNPSNVISMTTTKSTAGVFEAKAVEFVAAGDDADYAYFYFCENSGDTLADTGRHYGAVKQGIEVENEAVNSVVSGENAFKITPTKCNVKVDLNEGTLTVTWLADGINALSADDANAKVDVYNLKGVCILKNVDKADAMKHLDKGIYIIGGKKVRL